MPTPIDPKRLPGLKTALAAFGEDEMAAQRQLADLYGVANSRFTTLVKTRFPDFPAAERRPDKTFWYPARAAVQSMIAYMENSSRAAQAAAARHTAIMSGVEPKAVSGSISTDSIEPVAPAASSLPMSASELDRLASARTKVWKLQKDQGEYVPRAEVVRITRGANTLLTREIMNLPTAIDPNGELPAGTRDALAKRCRNVVMKLNEAFAAFLEDENDVGRAGGDAGARAGSASNLRRRNVPARRGSVGRAA